MTSSARARKEPATLGRGRAAAAADSSPRTAIPLFIRRRRVVRALVLVVVALGLLSLAGQVVKYWLGLPTVLGLVPFLYVDQENNLPTWYQSIALLGSAGLLALLAYSVRRSRAAFAPHWAGLSAIFVLLSIDEMGGIHERSMEPLQRLVGQLPGMWKPTWVILGLIAVAAVCAAYLRFFLHLSGRERLKVGLAAAMFVGGAIGMEMAAAHYGIGTSPALRENFTFALIAHVEEMLEMGGIVVFIDFLLERLAQFSPFTGVMAD